MKRNIRLSLSSAVAFTIAGAFPGAQILAQESATLEEVIVTARKREENLQEIPIAITAVSAADILEGDVTGLEDIAALAPGFYFFNQGGSQPGRDAEPGGDGDILRFFHHSGFLLYALTVCWCCEYVHGGVHGKDAGGKSREKEAQA